ncbi:M20 family metallopeptidase [Leucobacter sp. wl10]|uniref:M20 family metallopeptidase n=1 Tax=Leucobacter sp. wl10 TaxID=2304677 RepID=UPI000E5C0627|nr:M20 family metallopeptidase [Leucobacter sp. wl10]RGE23242.1 M20 family peptidase [Leucobacter sp. wl10]
MTTTSSSPEMRSRAKEVSRAEVEGRRDQLIALSHAIHEHPEVSWEEHEAAALVAKTLGEAGFDVEIGAYGVPTAVEAVYGDGDLTVAICAEYDALPGIGHGCGHNVIASAGVGAALGLAPVAEEAGLRIKLLGTPAEEHGGGKVSMLEAGAWEDVDISLMVHGITETPGMTADSHGARGMRSTAVDRFAVTFHGRTAHAAGMPEQGINASNAAVLGLNAFAMLRQHLPKETNLNAFISEGGEVTNIIPDRSVVQIELRAYDLDIWRDMKQRVLKCFEGAAIATGCEWEWTPTEHPYAPLVHDEAMADLWDRNLADRGRTIDRDAVLGGGSTDMGNVSRVVPSIHPMITFRGHSAPAHNPAFTEVAASPEGDEAVIDAAVTLAATVLDVAFDPGLRADYRRRSAERPEGATRVTLKA